MQKIEPQRPRRRSWSQIAAGSCFRSHFELFLSPPEPRKSCSRCSGSKIFRNQASRLGSSKSKPTWAQNRTPNDPQRPQDGPKNEFESMFKFKAKLKLKFNDSGTPRWAQKSIKNRSRRHKAAQRPPGVPQEASRTPQESFRRPPRGPPEGPESPEADPHDHKPQAHEATSPLAH